MKDYISVFKNNNFSLNEQEFIGQAMICLERFADCFNKEDLNGMDECCHFPHYIISGNEIICWDKPGVLKEDFFSNLKKSGFKRTQVDYIETILVSENKVHMKYGYSRIDMKEDVMSRHHNIWILTSVDNKWGIQVRSY